MCEHSAGEKKKQNKKAVTVIFSPGFYSRAGMLLMSWMHSVWLRCQPGLNLHLHSVSLRFSVCALSQMYSICMCRKKSSKLFVSIKSDSCDYQQKEAWMNTHTQAHTHDVTFAALACLHIQPHYSITVSSYRLVDWCDCEQHIFYSRCLNLRVRDHFKPMNPR